VRPEELDCADCLPEDLHQSPLYAGVKRSCALLQTMLDALNAQHVVISQCSDAFARCREGLTASTANGDRAVVAMRAHSAALDGAAERQRRDAEGLKSELAPFIEELFKREAVPLIPARDARYAEIEAQLKGDIEAACDDPKHVEGLAAELALVGECRRTREQVARLCEEGNDHLSSIAANSRAKLALVVEHCRTETGSRAREFEFPSVQRHENGMRDALGRSRLMN